jgi:signal transduction histidine kinase
VERFSGPSDRRGLEAVRHGYHRALAVARDLEVARGALPRRFVQRPEPVDLREIARRVVDTWNAPAAGRDAVVLDWRAGAAVVQGYPMRLTQALDNLVANAVEHGRGPVTVCGTMRGSCISVLVLDRGAGLMRPPEDLGARSLKARRGHGLVVARHAVELHGGTLRPVRCTLGAGIEIRLPVGASSAPAEVRGGTQLPNGPGPGVSVRSG